ncbi:hypothetical protein SDJN02_03591, partial [Cucurbita argyrosperma subsp. argyrosperma]
MSTPSVLPPLFLCIILLFIPIVSPETKISHSRGRNRPTATENPSPENQQSPSDGATENPMPRKHSKPLYAREFLTAHNKVRMNVTHPVLTTATATATATAGTAGTATATATATAGTAGTATATANGGGGTVAVDLKSKVPEPSPPSNEQIISPHRKLIG